MDFCLCSRRVKQNGIFCDSSLKRLDTGLVLLGKKGNLHHIFRININSHGDLLATDGGDRMGKKQVAESMK